MRESSRGSSGGAHLLERHAVASQQLGGHAAQSAQHGPAGVDKLQLAVALEGLGVSRQTGRVLEASTQQ